MPNANTDQLMHSLQRSGEINQNLRIEIEKLRAALAEAQKIGLETTTRCDEYMQDNERLAQEIGRLRQHQYPHTLEDIRAFIGTNFITMKYGREDQTPCDEDTYTLTAHDLASAFFDWSLDVLGEVTPL